MFRIAAVASLLVLVWTSQQTAAQAKSRRNRTRTAGETPYCEGFKFSLSYLVIPTIGLCGGSPDVQVEASVLGPIPLGVELGVSHTLSPESMQSMFYGVRAAHYSLIFSGFSKISLVLGHNTGNFFVEAGPAFFIPTSAEPSDDDDVGNSVLFDLKIGWEFR